MSNRANAAASARSVLGEDFFGGWQPEDFEILTKYRVQSVGTPGFVTDFLGMKTASHLVPWASGFDGAVLSEIPVPDDMVRAETIEYVALLQAIESSRGEHFAMVELGASYAPWTCAAGIVAVRAGKKRIALRSVEASSFFHQKITEHLADNGLLTPPAGVSIDVLPILGAVAVKRGVMYFPLVSSAGENGGAAADENLKIDYVGRSVEHEEVPAKPLDEILQGLGIIDLLHCDIQGAEREVLKGGAALLSERVRCMFVGTHSRSIEGELIECLHDYGWSLVRERPCRFLHKPDLRSTVGMTTRDGGQFWVNRRFF